MSQNNHSKTNWVLLRYYAAPLFLLLFLRLHAFAEQDSVHVNIQAKHITIAKIFKSLQRQTGFIVFYDNKVIDDQQQLNIDLTHSTIAELMNFVTNGKDVTFVIKGKFILLRQKNPAPNAIIRKAGTSLNETPASGNDTPISGVVKNSGGEPLAGVSVSLKGSKLATTTDDKGEFTLNLPSVGRKTLIFSYVGFETQEVGVAGESGIEIRLTASNSSLDQVVVTALGLRQERKALTYSSQSVNTERLSEAVDLNVINSLEGKVAGLTITQSGGGVAAPSRVILRGNRSISGDNQPLYVIDGVPTLGAPENLDPDNFASINVLKGANAAALYGSDAQNGAIIIATKKGKAGKIDISLNNTFMLQQADQGLKFQNQYAQGSTGIYQPGALYSWGPQMTGQAVQTWSQNPAKAGDSYALTPQPDNVNDLFHHGHTISNSLALSAGGPVTQTYFSATATEGAGIVPMNTLNRENFLFRITSKLTDKLSLDAKVNYTIQDIDNPTRQSDDNYNPVHQIYLIPRNIRTQDARQFEYPDAQGLMQQDFWSPGVVSTGENPYWVLNRNLGYDRAARMTGMASLTYDFTKELNLMVRGSYDRIDDNLQQMDYNGTLVRAPYGRYTVTTSDRYNVNSDILLSYNKKINKNWKLDLHAGGNLKKLDNETLSSNTGTALLAPNFFSLSNSNLPVTSFDPGSPINVQSLYAFGNINWKEAIFLSITGRNDWSSTLPAESRSYFYPSAGTSIILTNLFPSLTNIFSFAKIRSSYAKVGSSAPPFMLQQTATFSSGGNNGFLALNNILPNTNLKPEDTRSFEAGFNVGVFKGRLGVDFTYYNTNTKNQLFTISLPVGSGASSYYTNGGDVRNRGVEIVLTTTPIRSGQLRWDVDVNFATVKNTVLKISDQRPKIIIASQSYISDYVIQQGHNYGDMFTVGLMRDSLGRVIVGDNGIPQVTNQRSFDIGTYTPKWTAGISSSLTFKGKFTFTFLIDHRQGGIVEDYTDANLDYGGLSKNTLQGRDGSLVFGQNFFSKYQTVTAAGTPNKTPVSAEAFWTAMGNPSIPVGELYAKSATNTRLREVTVGYVLPATLAGRLHLARIKVSLVGRNLFFISRATPGLDPDILTGVAAASEGFSSFAPPTTRSYGVNLKIDFK